MEDHEYALVQRKTLALTGIDLGCYKSKQMRRRLDGQLRRAGYRSWTEYLGAIEKSPELLQQFKDFITINVSSFFRDPEKFAQMRTQVLPELLRRRGHLSVWSAGSSHGGEPYSLAMILAEDAPGKPHRIVGTDIDRLNLAKAKAGGPYTPDDVKAVPPLFLRKYFVIKGDQYWVSEKIKRMVRFQYLNLLQDSIQGRFDLIICRNVVIYFTDETKTELYRRFYDALVPGGVLFVGGTEIVTRAREIGFSSAGISFYRKNGVP